MKPEIRFLELFESGTPTPKQGDCVTTCFANFVPGESENERYEAIANRYRYLRRKKNIFYRLFATRNGTPNEWVEQIGQQLGLYRFMFPPMSLDIFLGWLPSLNINEMAIGCILLDEKGKRQEHMFFAKYDNENNTLYVRDKGNTFFEIVCVSEIYYKEPNGCH